MRQTILTVAISLGLASPIAAQTPSTLDEAITSGIEQLNENGANITFDSREVDDENALILRGVKSVTEDGKVIIETDWIRLAPSADVAGDVTVTIAPLVSATAPAGPEDTEVVTEMATEGFSLLTNWVDLMAESPRFDLVADRLTITSGNEAHPVVKGILIAAQGLDVSFDLDKASRGTNAEFASAALNIAYDIVSPEGGEMQFDFAIENMGLEAMAENIPEGEQELQEFIDNGGALRLTTTSGASQMSFTSNDPDLPISVESTTGAGSSEISLLEGKFLYQADFGPLAYTVTPDATVLPFPPVDASLASGSFDLRFPLGVSDVKSEASFAMSLVDLSVSDSAWALIDPESKIPRDPATLEIDIKSILRLIQPFPTDGSQADFGELFEADNVDVNRIYLSIAGALLSGSGTMTLDNSGPVPVPTGALDFSINGVQTLSQKLVDLGLIEQMQAGMTMGMLMAFSKPGDSPDTFTSKIEFKDGGVFANGVPIQ